MARKDSKMFPYMARVVFDVGFGNDLLYIPFTTNSPDIADVEDKLAALLYWRSITRATIAVYYDTDWVGAPSICSENTFFFALDGEGHPISYSLYLKRVDELLHDNEQEAK